MSFKYPLGLLALIGIPIVIAIYILRSKYREQTVSSTYIWQLSDKFLKRKNPFSGLTGIISLALQLLMITVIAFAVARPVITVPNSAHDYRFVLDSSASMQTEDGKQTRFDMAKSEIISIIKSSYGGSTYSLVSVSDEAETVFLFVSEKETAINMIEELSPSDTHGAPSALKDEAQKQFDDNASAHIYVLTDKSYEKTENVTLINVNGGEAKNYAVLGSSYSHSAGKLSVSATFTSYSDETEREVILSVDGAETARSTVKLTPGETSEIEFSLTAASFSGYTVSFALDDSYSLDDSYTVYNLKSDKKYSTLIVSKSGFFLESVIDALVDSEITVITPAEYASLTESYGLYIFDSYEPKQLPDAAVWLINPDESIPDSGFGIKGRINLDESEAMQKSASTASTVRKLLEGVEGEDVYVKSYVKYSGMYLPFSTLFSHGANPLIFAGANGLGNRQVVFGFDLHESDMVLSTDFLMLVRNLLNYSFPDVLDKTGYTVGEDAAINVLANAENLKAISPSGKEIYIDDDGAVGALLLDEVGTYTVQMTLAGTSSAYYIYSAAHGDESAPIVSEAEICITGEAKDERGDGKFDPTAILFICLAVLFIADWGVYCYEKYQLR